jgi:hypothetical protein
MVCVPFLERVALTSEFNRLREQWERISECSIGIDWWKSMSWPWIRKGISLDQNRKNQERDCIEWWS